MWVTIIIGQTCSGKSKAAVEIANLLQKRGFKVIIAGMDSRQVYKNFNIGTEKVKGKWIADTKGVKKFFYKKVEHCLIDYVDAGSLKGKNYDIYEYLKDLVKAIKENKPDHLIITGGTLYYYHKIHELLISGKLTVPNKLGKLQAKKIRDSFKNLSPDDLRNLIKREILNTEKPSELETLDFYNSRRIINKIINIQTKHDSFKKTLVVKKAFKINTYCLHQDRYKLRVKIADTVSKRISKGLFKEYLELKKRYGINFLISLGMDYRLCYFYDKGMITNNEWLNKTIVENQKYAKRQQTWLRKIESKIVKNSTEILQQLTMEGL